MEFEWDDEKERINIKKHGISFKVAKRVFLDENMVIMEDYEHSFYEERRIAIGMVGKLLFVVYTERGEVTRIISARKATKKERSIYYDSEK